MRGEQTVSDALRQTLKPTNAPHRRTVVLLRRSPEGQEQTLIDIDSAGRPIDPAQDVILREGDELVLPAQSMPDGLQRPPVLAIDGPPSQPYVGP